MSDDTSDTKTPERINPTLIEEEMKTSYLDYAMSVIVGRALPDMRDGLKPVHRRILYSMQELGVFHNKPYKKSARIVGDCLGKYHPHGDTAVYDSLVRMTQVFSLRYPLIAGQGNFGSIDGDNAAAMRYTEAKLSKLSEEMLTDLDKDTVDFTDNFDGSLKEPSVLPCKFPGLLVNGSSGIAVGMATNIPPHNLVEVCDGVVRLIDNPEITIAELMESVKGPDFPTGGIIRGIQGIHSAYNTGRGKIIMLGILNVEETKTGKERIVVSEIPYQVNKSALIEGIADKVRAGIIEGVSDIRDESDRDGMRLVFELKQNAASSVVINQLYKHSRLKSTFGIIMLGLVDNIPRVLNLKETMEQFLSHRVVVVRRRTEFELKKAQARAHILEGLVTALNDIDNVIKKIKQSKDAATAKDVLIADYSFSEDQAKAILDMKLQKLASLEQEKINIEHKSLTELIVELTSILDSKEKISQIIKDELILIKEKYGDSRRTSIEEGDIDDITDEDLIPVEDMIVTVSHTGYIKRLSPETYKTQGRGGRGVLGAASKDEDFIEHLFCASTHDHLLVFTNKGKIHWLKVYRIPEASRQARGKAIINLIKLDSEEKVTAFIPVSEFDDSHYLIMSTRNGVIKKSSLELYSNPRKTGIIGIGLNEGDELLNVVLTDGNDNIVIATKEGMAVRFHERDVRPMGRSATGVRGVRLKGDDQVIGMVRGDDTRTLLTITENGYGKRTIISDYRLTKRGGVGVKNIICSERNGEAVNVLSVIDEDDVMFISQNGVIIRTQVSGISTIGRSTQGVRLMKLKEGDRVGAAAKIIQE